MESVKAEVAQKGCRLTALAEYIEDGAWKALYLSPGYLEECAAELGLKIPINIGEALDAIGIHPVNLEELKHGR